MKLQTHAIMVALAIVFTVALTLTIVLICMDHDHTQSGTPTVMESTVHPQSSREASDLWRTTDGTDASYLTKSTTELTTAPTPVLPDISNGLSFVSLGNGTCRVDGIGTCSDACVVIPAYSPYGECVTEIADGAFFSCATISAVQIPETVTDIGDLAFAACKNLVYISVSEQNAVYRDIDGVLYSVDESVLICYPPMHAGEDVTIRTCTTVVSDMAFYGCKYLKTVHYTGSAEQWDSVFVGAKNYSLSAAAMTFAYAFGK